jgi:hypothetical protein
MNNSAINSIMAKLEEIFAEMDAKVLAGSQDWAKGRAEAVREFEANEENRKLRRSNVWGFYKQVHGLAGGKTWYAVVKQSEQVRSKFVEKNCKATVDRRNASIAKKLLKAEVAEVLSNEFTWTKDGFNGIFRVNTDKGEKRVKIETIYAGGYNIQCLHLRVLVNIK